MWIWAVAPRSTWIQPGSTQPTSVAVAHRVAGSKSNALSVVQPVQLGSFCCVDAVPGFLYDSRTSPLVGGFSVSLPVRTANSHSETPHWVARAVV